MSVPEPPRRLTLSPRARQDFIHILRYTGKTWGSAQLHAYRDKIDAALRTIAGNPDLGTQAPDLPATHRLFPVGAHVIVYRLIGDDVAVVRMLHQRMSRARHV